MHMQFFFVFVGSSVLIKILGISYLRNYCSYLLYICTDERIKTLPSENGIKLKNIQKIQK